MVNSRQKGAKAEEEVCAKLTQHTGYIFTRVPGSGCGRIKGDLHIEGSPNRFCIEIKHYAESPFSDKILTNKSNDFVQWWIKLLKQSDQMKQEPLLIWRYNRSKWFVSTNMKPAMVNNCLDWHLNSCYTMLLDEWLKKESIAWLK